MTEKTVKARKIVLIGRRADALAAAARLNLEVILVDALPGKGSYRFEPCDYSWNTSQWKEFSQDLCQRYPHLDAAVSLVERAVVPAAIIRQAYGLKGNSRKTSLLCTDKPKMKAAARQAGIPCARFATARQHLKREELIAFLGLPMVIKTYTGSGGRGTVTASTPQQVPEQLPKGWMAESFVAGQEFSIESLVCQGEILFTNCTEYLIPRWANLLPAQFSGRKMDRIRSFNQQVIRALNIREGISHLEVFDTPAGLWLGEIAIRPPGGHIMELMTEVYGFDSWQALLQLSLEELPLIQHRPQGCAGVIVIHPGEGTLVNIQGLLEARASTGVKAIKVNARIGDAIAERQGCGQQIAHIIVKGQTRREVVRNLQQARQFITTEIEGPT